MYSQKNRVPFGPIAAAILALGISVSSNSATSQTGPGWVTLLDGTKIGDWNRIGDGNWRLDNGAVAVDKKTTKGASYLVSKTAYKNFKIYAEVWASPKANSGIFIRCSDPKKINAKSCYEINIFDTRKDPSYGTGAIVNFAEVDPMPKAGGKWNTLEITADGRHLVVIFNGKKTADIRNGLFTNGPFALQYGTGVLKFRKVAIKPL